MRIDRCASSHAPGYVVADSGPACPTLTPTPDVHPAAAIAVKPLSASRRVMPLAMAEPPRLGVTGDASIMRARRRRRASAPSSYKEIEIASGPARRRADARRDHA